MRLLKQALERSATAASFDKRMVWAVLCTCFFRFFMSGKVTVPMINYDTGVYLSMNNVAIDSQEVGYTVLLRVKASKTNPFQLTVTIMVACRSPPQLYRGAGITTGAAVHLPEWESADPSNIGGPKKRDTGISWDGPYTLFRAQLLHRGTDNGHGVRSGGRHHSNPRQIGRLRICNFMHVPRSDLTAVAHTLVCS